MADLHSSWKGPIHYFLPGKLRGLGFRSSKASMLRLLENRSRRHCAALSIGIEREDPPSQSRWLGYPFEITPEAAVRTEWQPSLLKKGATSFKVVKQTAAATKTYKLVKVHEILLWFYFSNRLPEEILLGEKESGARDTRA
jgi:hypothetical protein